MNMFYLALKKITSLGESPYGKAKSVIFLFMVLQITSGCKTQPPEPQETIPLPPSNLIISTVGQDFVLLFWNDNSDNEDGFIIERSISDTLNFSTLVDINSNTINFIDSGLEPNTSYFYRIKAYNSAGSSTYSNVVNSTTLEAPPTAPSDLIISTVSQDSVSLSWTDNSDNEDGFIIERSISDTLNFSTLGDINSNTINFIDSGLEPNTSYFYRIKAYNSAGSSTYSNVVNSTTLEAAPNFPLNLTVSAIENHKVSLSWTDNSDNEDGFYLERSFSDTMDFQGIYTLFANDTTFTDSNLVPNSYYYYRIRAFNTVGVSPYSNIVNATTTILTIALIPDTLIIGLAQQGSLSLRIENLELPIFGISLRIGYISSMLSFVDSTGFDSGDFFGSNVLAFVEEDNSVIYLSLVLTQGEEAVSGSGTIGNITFKGYDLGSSEVMIIPSDLHFYDPYGSNIDFIYLEIENATIYVE